MSRSASLFLESIMDSKSLTSFSLKLILILEAVEKLQTCNQHFKAKHTNAFKTTRENNLMTEMKKVEEKDSVLLAPMTVLWISLENFHNSVR